MHFISKERWLNYFIAAQNNFKTIAFYDLWQLFLYAPPVLSVLE